MRALTVRQPWATAIVRMGKDIENRTRNIAGAYRGPVAIHAARALAENAIDDFNLRRAWHLAGLPQRPSGTAGIFEPLLLDYDGEEGEWLPLGAVIGVVDLVDAHTDSECFDLSLRMLASLYRSDPAAYREFPDGGAGGLIGRARMCSPWAMADHHHLVLANPRPLPEPIPYRGALGLWTLPDDVEARTREQVTP